MLQCYITFPSTNYAIRAEKLLKEEKLHFKMVPVPRSISSSCGIALRCSCQDVKTAADILRQYNIEFEGVHKIEDKGLPLSRLFTRKEEK